jgi:hypothetical protein
MVSVLIAGELYPQYKSYICMIERTRRRLMDFRLQSNDMIFFAGWALIPVVCDFNNPILAGHNGHIRSLSTSMSGIERANLRMRGGEDQGAVKVTTSADAQDSEKNKATSTYDVTFLRNEHLHDGESLFLTGDCDALGNFQPERAIPMQCTGGVRWTCEVCGP